MTPAHKSFLTVGIGASAGGLQALTRLLRALPERPGFALVVVQHLDPKSESHLAELLGKSSSMEVSAAAEGSRLEPNHVYVIQPNTRVAVTDGHLKVTPRPAAPSPDYPIDHLFRSLAAVEGSLSVGVVLSGTGSDGTLGAVEIKAGGGLTFAQFPESAEFHEMPQRAISSGAIDLVLKPEEIAERLSVLAGEGARVIAESDVAAAGEPQGFQRVISALRLTSGVDFSQYRDTTIHRRAMRRMLLKGLRAPEEYATIVERDPAEAEALYRDVLINVTSFFRDPGMFDELKRVVLPSIFAEKAEGLPIRVWVPGCSTGQEAYSLAMILVESMDKVHPRRQIQIFATDLGDVGILEKARVGLYPHSIEAEVAQERLDRFFVRDDHGYRVCREIREMCVFARQNITVDPPFSRVDLITCRNVLIYMSPPLQNRIVPIFHFALNPEGFLVLGGAETIGPFMDLFDVVDRSHRIYKRKESGRRAPLAFMSEHWLASSSPRRALSAGEPTFDPVREARRLTIDRYSPPSVLIDQNFDIQQFQGRTSLFLEPPSGTPTNNLLRMVKDGLLVELHASLNEAKASGAVVVREKLRAPGGEGDLEFTLRVVPVAGPGLQTVSNYIVYFEPTQVPAWSSNALNPRPNPASPEVEKLQHELSASKHYLQSIVDQQEASAQELRAAHEEVLSSNEELQSTNEELETTKEELQSANEELTTVNEQFQSRNRELDSLTDDLTNFLASAELPMVTVGRDLRIRRLTPAAERAFNLLPSDIGRSIEHINFSLKIDNIGTIIRRVAESFQPFATELKDAENRWWVLRVQPYRTSDNRVDGVTVVAMDIDVVKRGQEVVEARDYALAIVETVREPMVVLDETCRVGLANDAFYSLFGDPTRSLSGRLLWETGHPAWLDSPLRRVVQTACKDLRSITDLEVEVLFGVGGRRTLILNSRSVERHERPTLLLLSIMDITDSRQAEKLRIDADTLRLLDRKKDEFLGILAHELRNPLGPMRFALEIMRRTDDEEEVKRSRQVLERQVTHLSRIVDDLLDVSRITQGKVELRKELLDLSVVVRNAVEMARPAIDKAHHTLTVSLPDETVWLEGDAIRINQIITNLLNNAVKFTPPGGHIWLMAEKTGEDLLHPDQLRIRLRDTGIGIEPEAHARIFEMFQQGDQSLERTRGGLGVGLTLVRNLMTLHGGRVEVESEGRERGSTFVLTFPLKPTRQAFTPSPDAEEAPRPSPRRRILVADDNRDGRDALAYLLSEDGHTVETAVDGADSVEKGKAFLPEVAILDIGMPRKNGYEVAAAFKADARLRNTILVALSGLGRAEDQERAIEAGFARHFTKPVEIEVLQRFLAQLGEPGSN